MAVWRSKALVGALVALVVACATVSPTVAMEAKLMRTAEGRTVLLLEGAVEPDSSQRVVPALRRGGFAEIWLRSPGGSVKQAYEIGRAIRQMRLATRVAADALCASACVDIFLGGVVRFADPGARIVVHPGSISANEQAQRIAEAGVREGKTEKMIQLFEQNATRETVDWTRYLGFMGISQKLVEYAALVPHRCGIELRPQEMVYFNVVNTGGAPRSGYTPSDPVKVGRDPVCRS